MASASIGAVRLVDKSGDPLDDDAGRLKIFLEAADLNIGNVDVVSVPAPLSVVGGGTEDAALRVTLANNSTGVITVDGSVTVNTISGFATSGNQLAAGHTVDCDDSDVNVTNMISGFAIASKQLAAGHTIDCNDSDVNVTNMISGFATSALQPSLGTAGTASANVITVQGIASMTPLLATVTQQSTARTVTCDTAGNLLATVTQDSAARTKAIAGTVDMGTQVSVGSSTTEIVDALGDRMAIIIVNDSDEVIYLMLGASAIMNRGIRLNANGGSFSTEMYQGVINGICASGSKNVTVTEISP